MPWGEVSSSSQLIGEAFSSHSHPTVFPCLVVISLNTLDTPELHQPPTRRLTGGNKNTNSKNNNNKKPVFCWFNQLIWLNWCVWGLPEATQGMRTGLGLGRRAGSGGKAWERRVWRRETHPTGSTKLLTLVQSLTDLCPLPRVLKGFSSSWQLHTVWGCKRCFAGAVKSHGTASPGTVLLFGCSFWVFTP